MKNEQITTIFVDCFNTIIIRNIKNKEVFKLWAKELSKQYDIPWNVFYKTYKKVNFNLCFKKLLLSLTLQENFDVVLNKMFTKLQKKYPVLSDTEFVTNAKNLYIQTELENFSLNDEMIKLLEEAKNSNKQIYLVSDFYCTSDTFIYWFDELKISHLFNSIFSSCDNLKEKATGKIYKMLIKKLDLNPKNIKMYGDNIWSDIFMAKVHGLNTQRIKSSKEHK